MKQIKVSDLEGEQLAEWAARARGWKLLKSDCEPYGIWVRGESFMTWEEDYRPDINGAQAMELLEHDEIVGFLTYTEEGKTVYCVEYGNEDRWAHGATLKIATCRARIASVYGETVTVEDE